MTDPKDRLIVYYDGSCPSCVEDRERYERMAGEGARAAYRPGLSQIQPRSAVR